MGDSDDACDDVSAGKDLSKWIELDKDKKKR